MGIWDELIDDKSRASGICEAGDWKDTGTGKQRVSEIVHAANAHMEDCHHSVAVDVELSFSAAADAPAQCDERKQLEDELASERACLQVYGLFRYSGTPRAVQAARRIREIEALLQPGVP